MRCPPAAGRHDDTGSAVVEFSLVTIVLLVLFLGLVQLGLALHVRNTVAACAAEGARYGANADRIPADGADRTALLVRDALGVRFAADVSAAQVIDDGVPQVEVRVSATLPLLGFLGPRDLTVVAHAMDEG